MEVDTKHGILKDTLESLSLMGLTYVKCDGESIFFIVNEDSELTRGCEKLKGIKHFMDSQFGYKLMVGFKKKQEDVMQS